MNCPDPIFSAAQVTIITTALTAAAVAVSGLVIAFVAKTL
ncbi:hypothetical protein LCGC14_2897810, partial [marine sediment metagenome]